MHFVAKLWFSPQLEPARPNKSPLGFPCLYFLHRVSIAPYKTEYIVNILYELHFLLVGWWRPTVAPGRWLKDTGKLEGSRYVWQKIGENVKEGKAAQKKGGRGNFGVLVGI